MNKYEADFHYSKEDIVNALKSLGIGQGDIVFSHSNIGYFGRPDGEKTPENSFNTILSAFMEVLGDSGTLCVPTFTYSLSTGKLFDWNNTPSDCGIFTEMLRNHPGAVRSIDPNVSVAGIGKDANVLLTDASENAYDENSFFGRFYNSGGKIVNMNFDAGSTLIHYFERLLKVPYRFDKTFKGIMIKDGAEIERSSTIFVRELMEGTQASFELFNKLAIKDGLYKKATVGRGSIGAITAEDTYKLIKKYIVQYPDMLLLRGKGKYIIDK